MSDLATALGVARTDVIPDHICARATLEDFGQAEEEFERRHIRKAAESIIGLPGSTQELVIAAATLDIANGRYKYGRWAFDAHAKSPTSHGFLLYLLLRRHHPDMTPPKAAALLAKGNPAEIGRKILEQFGYNIGKDAPPGNGGAAMTDPSGPTSSPPSEKMD